jgi:hypothetical protein
MAGRAARPERELEHPQRQVPPGGQDEQLEGPRRARWHGGAELHVGHEPPIILPTNQLPPAKGDLGRRKALDSIPKMIERIGDSHLSIGIQTGDLIRYGVSVCPTPSRASDCRPRSY